MERQATAGRGHWAEMAKREAKAGSQAVAQLAEREAKADRRTLFAAVDAITIGGMVAIGVFCRRAVVPGGRYAGMAASSIYLELAKAVKRLLSR